jgi:hypothetical protein
MQSPVAPYREPALRSPSANPEDALLNELAALIQWKGFETFVHAPLIEPSSIFFPDPWEPSLRGARALALRLMTYATLKELDALVQTNESFADEFRHTESALYFTGIEGATCTFGANAGRLGDVDKIVGSLCHEVAHAWREHHGIVEAPGQVEEESTDVTTIYVGFGILTLNNTYRSRSSVGPRGALVATRWSVAEGGYLTPERMAFLLAAQVVARGCEKHEIRRIADLLEANQSALFRKACDELSNDVAGLRLRLGIPPRETWPEAPSFVVHPLREDARFAPDNDLEATRAQNAQTFRVSEARFAGYSTLAAGSFAILAHVALGLPDVGVVVVAFLGAVLGAILAHLRRFDVCANSDCEALIPPRATHCPGCDGKVMGRIAHASDRLAALEAFDDEEDEPTARRAHSLNRK